MGVERCSSLASTGRYQTQGLNQVKEFEKLLYESGTTILKFFLHISKDEQKERLGWASRGGAAMTPFPHFFVYLGYVDVETTSLQRGIELSRCDHYGPLSSATASLVFGAPSGYVLCSTSQCEGN
jgi:Polyphosphate kinase 2 (PPK2)